MHILRRFFYLLLLILLPLLSLVDWTLHSRAAPLAPGTVIINEWSQGTGGSKEWVELLVVEGPADLRGWDLGDSSPGDLTFQEDPLWSAVPAGTLILIYNAADPDDLLPPPDLNVDNCRLVLPHDDNRFAGTWPAFANTNAADNPHLRNSGDVTVHDYTGTPGEPRPGSGKAVAFLGATASQIANSPAWQLTDATAATPGTGNNAANSGWIDALCTGTTPQLNLLKEAPARAAPGDTLAYRLTLRNTGSDPVAGITLTDRLPAGVTFISDDSGLPRHMPEPGVLRWKVGQLAAGAELSFSLQVTTREETTGTLTNIAEAAGTAAGEAVAASATAATVVAAAPSVLISAVLYDGLEAGDLDEAVALYNAGTAAVNLDGWQIADAGGSAATIAGNLTLPPAGTVWLTRDDAAFRRQFGFAPDAAPDRWPGFSNTGDSITLHDSTGMALDTLVYGTGAVPPAGWTGPAVQPYTVRGVFGREGQLLYRRLDEHTGLPAADTDTAFDWAQDAGDWPAGRQVRFPGWNLEQFFLPARATEQAWVQAAIAPDHALETLLTHIDAARASILVETLTFENLAVADALIAAVRRGVAVKVLLEGAPAGGLPPQEQYVCRALEQAGGECWFMIGDADARIYDRYRYLHAKFMIIDSRVAVVGSENLSPDSLPADDKSDGTFGRRGVLLFTNAPPIVARLQAIFDHDLDPGNHVDIFRWQPDHPRYGPPPAGFVPLRESGGVTYTVRYEQPLTVSGTLDLEIVQSPENSIHRAGGLLGLVGSVEQGDVLLVQQLREPPAWGDAQNGTQVLNPRLQAYLDAARRGARVRVLLDAFFDDERSATSNAATCELLEAYAQQEKLSLTCARANPTGLGIHNKMVLARIDGRGYVHVGSLNGTEQSAKGNREVALQVQSDDLYDLLADMFERDYPHVAHFPLLISDPFGVAAHVLIGEVLYDPPGADEAEFVELVNPTPLAADLSGYGLGDAVNRDDFEDLRRFPSGTILPPREVLVVATGAAPFFAEYGRYPDYEILDTEPGVPNLVDDASWGDTAALLRFGNAGDEVLLRAPDDRVVDAIAYGNSLYLTAPCALVATAHSSLERYPYWRDTDSCSFDFREWPFPNPGALP